MWNRKRNAALALIALASWACSPDGYPSEPRFDAPPDVVELPDGELFFYTPPAGVSVSSVSVPGEFNGWNPGDPAAQMIELPDGRWVAGIDLEPGTYQYKYHFNGTDWAGNMCNDGTWGDPDNGNQVDPDLDECHEGGNAIRTVGVPGMFTFHYVVPTGVDVTSVNLAGNLVEPNWTPAETPMQAVWSFTVDLEPGSYMYKYVFNGDGWVGNMCNDATWGDATAGGDVDPDIDECNAADNNNGVLEIDEAGPYTFRYVVPANVDPATIESIGVAGNFHTPNWDPSAGLMTETYTVTLDLGGLAPGEYLYKYVFNGDQWADHMCNSTLWGHPAFENRIDPDAEECVDDGFGGANAVLTID